jgi:hypothetical protein
MLDARYLINKKEGISVLSSIQRPVSSIYSSLAPQRVTKTLAQTWHART